jgi:hypothetical protein
MAAPLKTWEVLPHGKLTPIEQNILTVVGDIRMPVGNMKRRMTVVRTHDRQLVVYSAIALDEDEMRTLEEFGVPAFLIVPNDHHRLDARLWKDRYPGMKVIAPQGALEKVAKVVPVDATDIDFNDPAVRLVVVPGTRAHEVALEVTGPNGTTLVVNDIIGNIRDAAGFGGWLLRIMGFAGDEPHVPMPVRLAMVDDKAALAAQLRQWADMPLLKRIVVSHGETIEHDPSGALRALAAKLG